MTYLFYQLLNCIEVKKNSMKMKSFNIDAIIVDLSKFESLLKADSDEKRIFLINFKKWVDQRRDTVAKLEKLKKELDDICFKAKVGKLIGIGSSVVGTVAAVVGFGLSFNRNEPIRTIGKNLTKWGVSAGAIGGGTASVVSTAVESIVNQRILTEVKTTLDKDDQLTSRLVPYLEKSEAFNSLFCQIFNCDIILSKSVETVEDFFTVVRGITSLYKEGKYTYEKISEAFSFSVNECSKSLELKKIKRIFQTLSEKLQFVLIEFCTNPKVREAIWKIEQASPAAFDIASTCIHLSCRMFGVTKRPDIILLYSVLAAKDVVDSIIKAKDIASFESKYSGMVEDIKSLLIKELNAATHAAILFGYEI